MTLRLQEMTLRFQVLNLFRGFIDHLYKLDIVVPGIECAMAYLLHYQVITAADIWVFTRVVEDAMLFVLVRSREQAKLESWRKLYSHHFTPIPANTCGVVSAHICPDSPAFQWQSSLNMTGIYRGTEKSNRCTFVQENLKSNVGSLRALLQSLAVHTKRTGHICKTEMRREKGGSLGESAESPVLQRESSHRDLGVRLRNFTYQRGRVHVRIGHFDDVVLRSGKVYAITGANGCGKSTFFALLASCGRFSSALPPGMEESESKDGGSLLLDGGVMQGIVLQSDDIVEISQQMYCPLYIEPMAWLQRHAASTSQDQIPELLSELDFVKESLNGKSKTSTLAKSSLNTLDSFDFNSVQTNWYGKLSGGQRSKAELVSQVFMRQKCPDILLIDEALAPLDADSKILVQRKLKSFCNESVLLVIHHMDSHNQCVSSGNFFDDNLHFENGKASLIGTCEREKEGKKKLESW
eukprot:Skav226646  [mRNA]  locus=scaffold1:57871:59432:- [translate_table: standard]